MIKGKTRTHCLVVNTFIEIWYLLVNKSESPENEISSLFEKFRASRNKTPIAYCTYINRNQIKHECVALSSEG
jgi:hypothetical protein